MKAISPELQEQIEREAEAYDISFSSEATQGYINGATPWAAKYQNSERLRKEAMELLVPLLDYGQSKEANIPLGASVTTVILQRAKQFEQARKALEEIAELPISHPVGFAKAIAGEALASWKDEGNDTPGKAGRICCDCGTFVTSGACPECCPMG